MWLKRTFAPLCTILEKLWALGWHPQNQTPQSPSFSHPLSPFTLRHLLHSEVVKTSGTSPSKRVIFSGALKGETEKGSKWASMKSMICSPVSFSMQLQTILFDQWSGLLRFHLLWFEIDVVLLGRSTYPWSRGSQMKHNVSDKTHLAASLFRTGCFCVNWVGIFFLPFLWTHFTCIHNDNTLRPSD